MRRLLMAWAALMPVLAVPLLAVPQVAGGQSPATTVLGRSLSANLARAHATSGAYVADLTAGRTLYSANANARRIPASVEKLYTTSTALLRFGSSGRLRTSVLGIGTLDSARGWHGTLYLRGGGDPTFGSQGFDRYYYNGGATMQQLVANLIKTTGLTSVSGSIVGDESYFDSLRGTPPYGYRAVPDLEGVLSGLAYNRGQAAGATRPPLFAAQRFVLALKAAGVTVRRGTRVAAGRTPAAARVLARVSSPTMSWLAHQTNTPSDNFFAEMLLKDLGARFGGAGTTATGTAVVQAQMITTFGITPHVDDGSGLSRSDQTSPAEVVAFLARMVSDHAFTDSLAVAGQTGTMKIGLRGTPAEGRCRGKTGTLSDVANLVGYCTARNGHTLAFAILMNAGAPNAGRAAENRMAVALSQYAG